MNFTGIDGCRGGWFCITLRESGKWEYQVVAVTDTLAELVAGATMALIDIPVGLAGCGVTERLCDREARRALGMPRAASVFPAPARAVLDAENYESALLLNRQLTGKGISKQAWNIAPKILEVDRLLRNHPGLQGTLRESHPEVCFRALNNTAPMNHNKKTNEGYEERLAVLKRYLPQAGTLVEAATGDFPRKQVVRDDIVDALALAVTARLGRRRLVTLPENPPLDEFGLAMEIVYAEA